VFVLLFSIIIFGERLNALQWVGVLLVLASIWLLSLASAKEGISFGNNKGVFALFISIFAGVASALWDKYIITGMDPLFVQSWTNLYITVILGLIIVIKQLADKKKLEKFHWDWTLLLIAVLITLADALYFFALKQPDAMLGVISIIRRSSIIVSFVLGAFIFKEKKLKRKSLALVLMLGGVILTMFGTL
jgi:transporter family protein